MTATFDINGDVQEVHAGCTVACGYGADDPDWTGHPEWCERSVGSNAVGVTEPGWVDTQFWCAVVNSRLRGSYPRSYIRDSERLRDGVQLQVNVRGEDVAFTEDAGGGWRELKFNLDAGQARQLAAQLIAAADSHDNLNQEAHIMRRLEKIASHVGVNIWGA